ncbi:MAG: hypothetical protein Q9227_005930 [Pyrenula ochraceoflavens]
MARLQTCPALSVLQLTLVFNWLVFFGFTIHIPWTAFYRRLEHGAQNQKNSSSEVEQVQALGATTRVPQVTEPQSSLPLPNLAHEILLGKRTVISRQNRNVSICNELKDWNGFESYIKSSAGPFLDDCLKQHRHTEEYKKEKNFPKYFVASLLHGFDNFRCSPCEGCTDVQCIDVIYGLKNNTVTRESVEPVLYNIYAIRNYYEFPKKIFQVLPAVSDRTDASIPQIVDTFSWHYNPDIRKYCDEKAKKIMGGIQAAILFAFLGVGDAVAPMLGSVATSMAAQAARKQRLLPRAEKTTKEALTKKYKKNIGADDYRPWASMFATSATAVNNQISADTLGGLPGKVCKDKPNADPKEGEKTKDAAIEILQDKLFQMEQSLENITIYLSGDSEDLQQEFAKSDTPTLPDIIMAGQTALNDSQIDTLEHLTHLGTGLVQLLRTWVAMWVMKVQLAGVFCWRHPSRRCSGEDLKTYTVCVDPDQGIQCRAASWGRWKEGPNLHPLWGEEAMKQRMLGWNYTELVLSSWEHYKLNGLKTESQNLQATTDAWVNHGVFDLTAYLHLPVCDDSIDGVYPLPIVGKSPGQNPVEDYESLPGDLKLFGCNCGDSGAETRLFWESVGFTGTEHDDSMIGVCRGMTERGYNQNNPVQLFLSYCDMYDDFDSRCQEIEEQYNDKRKSPTVDSKAAACWVVQKSDAWAKMTDDDNRSRHSHGFPKIAEWVKNWQPQAKCPEHWEDDMDGTVLKCMDPTKESPTVIGAMKDLGEHIKDDDEYGRDTIIARAYTSTGDLYIAQLLGTPDEKDSNGALVEKSIPGSTVRKLLVTAWEKCGGHHHAIELPITYPSPDNGQKGVLYIRRTVQHALINEDGKIELFTYGVFKHVRGCGADPMDGSATLCLHGQQVYDGHDPKKNYELAADFSVKMEGD